MVCVRTLLIAGVTGMFAAPAMADVNLSLLPEDQTVTVGSTVSISLVASSDSDATQLVSAIQAVFTWDTAFLDLIGTTQTGAVPLLFTSFGPHPSNLNEANPPQDGDGMFQCGALLGDPIDATPAGVIITTFQFLALAPTAGTPVGLPLVLQGPGGSGQTIVFDGVTPNLDVTGLLAGAMVEIIPVPGPGAAVLLGLAGLVARRRRWSMRG